VSRLIAVAVSKGDIVLLEREEGGPRLPRTVERVHNGTPHLGAVRWDLAGGGTVDLEALEPVEVVTYG